LVPGAGTQNWGLGASPGENKVRHNILFNTNYNMNTKLMLKLINIFKDNFYHPLLCIHYIGIPVPSISGNKYKYLLFTIELHSHYIVQYRLLDKKPSKKNVEDILENISNVTSIKNV